MKKLAFSIQLKVGVGRTVGKKKKRRTKRNPLTKRGEERNGESIPTLVGRCNLSDPFFASLLC